MLLKIFHKIKEFTIAHKMGSLFFAGGIFLLLPIYDNALNLDGDKSPYSSGLVIELMEKELVNYTPEYGSYIHYFFELICMPFYLLVGIAMQEEEYRLSMLPGFVMYFVAWLLVFAYHCFMLILPFKLKTFLQAEKKTQKKFLYWLYGLSFPGILLSMAYILVCFSAGRFFEDYTNWSARWWWLCHLPLSGYLPIIYFAAIIALYQYKYLKKQK